MGLYIHQWNRKHKRGVRFENILLQESACVWAVLADGRRVEIGVSARAGISLRSLDGILIISPQATNAFDVQGDGF